jgi:predicted helicase
MNITPKSGYIYIRNHESYDLTNSCKLGKTDNIPSRDDAYATGEIKRGYFELVIEMSDIDKIEKALQNYFNSLGLHIKFDGGSEFYKREIINLIIPYLQKTNIKFKILSKEEINILKRKYRLTQLVDKIKRQVKIYNIKFKKTKLIVKKYEPRIDQKIIIDKSIEYFKTNDKGLLVLMCGVGKTLISLWITQKINSNTIIIGVPNKLLLQQWEQIICILFHNFPYLIVSGGVTIDNIIQFLKNNQTKCIIITTYSSAHKVYSASKNLSFTFNIKILDEVHHLTSVNMKLSNTTKKYIQMLKIESSKQLSLTATLKEIENKSEDDNIISNDNIKYFGEIIDRKCLLWAITEKIICDYVIQTIIANQEQLENQLSKFNIIDENDKRLFLSAFACLKSIYEEHSHHLLIYSNNKDNSLKLIQYIKMLLDDNYFNIPTLYYSNYHSEMKLKDQVNIINDFEQSKFGIITCVYCLGEGWDFPLLDGVVFSENMTSNIRIVQSALRASRKNKLEPNKITKIILPILNRNDWIGDNDNLDLKKVREVIYQMGLEDETIIHKIKVLKINIEKPNPNPNPNPPGKDKKKVDEFGEYDAELTQQLKLKTIKRTSLGISYEKARKIIFEKNIKTKESYYELCDKDIRLSKEPDILYKSQFTNWIDYLNIPRIYYNLETCKNKINELLTLHPEFKKYYLDLSIVSKELCKLDSNFPPNGLWVEYYNIKDLQDIIIIKNKKKIAIVL